MIPDRKIYPQDEAIELLGGIGRTTLWRLVKDGQLEQVRIGRRAFITAESIDSYITNLSKEN